MIAVSRLVRDVLDVARIDSGQSTDFRVAFSSDELSVRGHPVELQQALLNVVRNAAERAADALVAINVYSEGTDVVIAVENGLSAGGAERAGMRIGLVVARSIVEAAGGQTVWLPNGKTARVEVRLPRIKHA